MTGLNPDLALALNWPPSNPGFPPFDTYTVTSSTSATGTFGNPQQYVSPGPGAPGELVYTGLLASTDYYFRIVAANATGAGPISSTFGPFTTNNGNLVSTSLISAASTATNPINIVFLAEGYRVSEQAAFDSTCSGLMNGFMSLAPLAANTSKINFYKINVNSTVSTNSGLTSVPQKSYFGTYNTTQVFFDISIVTHAMTQTIPAYTVAVLVININDSAPSPRVDAIPTALSGIGSICCTTSANVVIGGATNNPQPPWWVFAHEMGHALFGLADEYVVTTGAYTGAEPSEPNITINTNRNTIKWRNLISPTTALPTVTNPGCGGVSVPTGVLPSGVIGLYEGAGPGGCGVYRPDVICHMLDVATLTGNPQTVITFVPFCNVCVQAMNAKFATIS